MRTAFELRIQLGLENQKKLIHTINDPSSNIHPASLTAVGTCLCWVPIFMSLMRARDIAVVRPLTNRYQKVLIDRALSAYLCQYPKETMLLLVYCVTG